MSQGFLKCDGIDQEKNGRTGTGWPIYLFCCHGTTSSFSSLNNGQGATVWTKYNLTTMTHLLCPKYEINEQI